MSTPNAFATQSRALLQSTRFQGAKRELLAAIAEASQGLREVRPPSGSSEARDAYKKAVQDFAKERGRDLYFPYLSSGLGAGPFVELLDGSVKYDMITGIGISLFGHTNADYIAEMIDGLGADLWQGNLQPGHEAKDLIHALLSRVTDSRLKQAWINTCGTTANETALKIIRQKKAPATKVIAFRDAFAGRSTAMQEITDNPKYREGQPVYGEVYYLSFYDTKKGLQENIDLTLSQLRDHLTRFPGKFCGLMMELVQGEGGFNYAPRDWYVALFEEAKKAGLAIWADEIQTFGRTGELFAFQTLGLQQYMDVVTVAKAPQASLVLFTEEYNPKPGLVSGTFTGPSVALRAARRTLELLDERKMLGKDGQIAKLSARFAANLRKSQEGAAKGLIGEVRAIGGMIALQPFAGTADDVKAVLMKLFDLGVVAFMCGHGPYLVRLLPPMGAITEKDVDQVCQLIEKAIVEVARERSAARPATATEKKA